MKAVAALTSNGAQLAANIGKALNADVYINKRLMESLEFNGTIAIDCDFTDFTGRLFDKYNEIILIMACGIAVRAIAPYIKGKTVDPAVVVLDEKGRHVISLLSGHIGGANKLAKEVASITGGTPVITTSTDVNGVISFDMFAVKNRCVIENIQELKYISSELVNSGKVHLYSDYDIEGIFGDNVVKYETGNGFVGHAVVISSRTGLELKAGKVLYIRPKNLVLGIGCRKGTGKEAIESAVLDFMQRNNRSMSSIKCMATVDLKEDEQGLIEFCQSCGIYLNVVTREDIRAVEGNFTASLFVRESTGVSSVAEPCAVLSGKNAVLICPKTVYKGITLALAEEEKRFLL
jgi:cobalt-precorrin 5A hydrolase